MKEEGKNEVREEEMGRGPSRRVGEKVGREHFKDYVSRDIKRTNYIKSVLEYNICKLEVIILVTR